MGIGSKVCDGDEDCRKPEDWPTVEETGSFGVALVGTSVDAFEDAGGGGCIELSPVGIPEELYWKLGYEGRMVERERPLGMVEQVRTATVMTTAALERSVNTLHGVVRRSLTRLCHR